MKRNRIVYFLLIVLTLFLGLASRHYYAFLPQWVHAYLGDGLWALMVFLMLGFVFRRKDTLTIAILAMAFSCAIEISQLYHAPWIDALRGNKLGGLILGFGFLWSDLICYTIGIGVGVLIETVFSTMKMKKLK